MTSIVEEPTFDVVDVFASRPGKGNPVAIVYGCVDRPAEWQQSFSHWIGLPETVFVGDIEEKGPRVSLRIFSPTMELPFAGHPAIGTVRSLIDRKLVPEGAQEITLKCKAGDVCMTIDGRSTDPAIYFKTPKPANVISANDIREEVQQALGSAAKPLSVLTADTGARWLVATFAKPGDLRSLRPDFGWVDALSRRFDVSGISVVAPLGSKDAEYEVRSFAPRIGVSEDAVCGGGNACVAAVIAAQTGYAPKSACYTASQGASLNRDGRVVCEGPIDDRRFRIGGRTHVVMSGKLSLDIAAEHGSPR